MSSCKKRGGLNGGVYKECLIERECSIRDIFNDVFDHVDLVTLNDDDVEKLNVDDCAFHVPVSFPPNAFHFLQYFSYAVPLFLEST